MLNSLPGSWISVSTQLLTILIPKSNFTSQVNQRANYQQLTLFDLG